ncbi:MAG: GNAT family N-acetyltransferase [Planctomycetota bacterium]|jgi:GNAT superfamily N-acetyltransferase
MSQITVRRADPSADREAILFVLARNLAEAAGAQRHDWLYLRNPDGEALVWLAEDEEGRPVGTSAAHPRRMRIDGTTVAALNLSDFAFDPAYRSLGPALHLLRATLEPVRRGEYAFSYDFPSQTMHAIYQRMGGIDLGPKQRWLRPVDLKAIAKRKIGGVVGSVVGTAGDVAMRARDVLAGTPSGIDIAPLDGEFGAEFDALDARLARLRPVNGVRDAAYLDWRYGRHAEWDHHVLCAHRAQELVGFAVLRSVEPGVVNLVDLFAEEGNGVRRGLVAAAVEFARARDAEAIHVEVLAGTAPARMFAKLGFRKRDQGPGPVPFVPPDSPDAGILTAPESWWITGGDRDV